MTECQNIALSASGDPFCHLCFVIPPAFVICQPPAEAAATCSRAVVPVDTGPGRMPTTLLLALNFYMGHTCTASFAHTDRDCFSLH